MRISRAPRVFGERKFRNFKTSCPQT